MRTKASINLHVSPLADLCGQQCGRASSTLGRGRAQQLAVAGSDEDGPRAAATYTLIETAKLNGIDPQDWLANVITPSPDHFDKPSAARCSWAWRPRMVPQAAEDIEEPPEEA